MEQGKGKETQAKRRMEDEARNRIHSVPSMNTVHDMSKQKIKFTGPGVVLQT